jgi:hypothetical protein
MGHVAATELTLSRRRGLRPRDTWQRRSSPQHGGEVWGRSTHGSAGVNLCKEVWSTVTAYVACGVPGLQGTDKLEQMFIEGETFLLFN